jgi:hypothetical protein
MGLERAVANGARLSADAANGHAAPITYPAADTAELARIRQENEDLKQKQAEAATRLDKLIDSLSRKMELDA